MKKAFPVLSLLIGGLIGYLITKYVLQNSAQQSCAINLVKSSEKDASIAELSPRSALLLASQAEDYLTNFKTTRPPGTSISFSIDSLDAATLLSNPKASKGIRVYFGVKNTAKPNEITLMIAAVDEDSENLFIDISGDKYVVDYTNPCPKDCPLNASTNTFDRRTILP